MQAVERRRVVPKYIVESEKDVIEYGQQRSVGVRAEYKRALYLHVLETDEVVRQWPASESVNNPTSPRRAPKGQLDWWVVVRGAKAKWPELGLRSTGRRLTDAAVAEIENAVSPGRARTR